ncbi:MAG: chaperone modulator CbpM [Gammaproteobacteria bacterium]|jgi:chaperone modulatory protein CbpM
MNEEMPPVLSGELLDEELELTVVELRRICRLSAAELMELAEAGVIEPLGRPATSWRFHGSSVRRAHGAIQLHRDLGVNWQGAALVLDLLEEIEFLRRRLARFDG